MTTDQKRAAFETAYEELFSYVYRYIRWRLTDRDDTADLVSGIFLSAWQHIDQFDPDRGNLRQWVTGIARNELAQYWRSHRIQLSIDELSDSMLGSIEYLITDINIKKLDEQALVTALLDGLPPDIRRLVILHYVDGLNYEMIATIIDKKPATVRKLFSRLHASLQRDYHHLATVTSQ
jgi:RNA polymerase sigma-70 factor (ECF subfamily)